MIWAFIKGILLGFSLVIPLGPQNAYIFSHASGHKRYRSTFPVVITSAICDALLIVLAVLGVDLIFQIHFLRPLLLGAGICFLTFIGISTWKNSTNLEVSPGQRTYSLTKQIIYTASISLLNPHAVLDTFVVIGATSSTFFGLEKHAFTFGCISIDIVWFLLLAAIGFRLGKFNNSEKIIKIVNRVSSIIMLMIAFNMTFILINSIWR